MREQQNGVSRVISSLSVEEIQRYIEIERDLGQFLFVLYLFLADSVTFSARLLQSILVFSSRLRLTSYSRHEVTLCG